MPYFNSKETAPVKEVESRDQTAPEAPWNVIVENDPVNLMSYVVMVFRKVFGYDRERATRHMLEVHEQGRSVLWTGERESAEAYVYALHNWKLNARLESDA